MNPCFILVGGSLGAGKTTTIARLARTYTDQGEKIGIVTNDQAIVRQRLSDAAASMGGTVRVDSIQSFRPSRPVPTHWLN